MPRLATFAVFSLFVAALSVKAGAAGQLARQEWKVGDDTREALVYVPGKIPEGGCPVIFVFHGHGGTMKFVAKSQPFHELWPEAIVLYPQGLLTATPLDPDGKKAGWQHFQGNDKDRDLRFVDAMLASLKAKHKIDDSRIFAMGHSNGGAFTILLWSARGDTFSAFAPSAAVNGKSLKNVKPRPVIHIAGEKDTIVPYAMQKLAINAAKKINAVDGEGKALGKGGLVYTSPKGPAFATYLHEGDHKFPPEALPVIVQFFKEYGAKK